MADEKEQFVAHVECEEIFFTCTCSLSKSLCACPQRTCTCGTCMSAQYVELFSAGYTVTNVGWLHSRLFSQSVTIADLNNGAQSESDMVLVTPMAPGAVIRAMLPQQIVTRQAPKVSPINMVYLKAVSRENSKYAKTFTLRHIHTTNVLNSDDELIKEKLGGDLKDCGDFDVGYVQGPGNRVVTIRTEENLSDV